MNEELIRTAIHSAIYKLAGSFDDAEALTARVAALSAVGEPDLIEAIEWAKHEAEFSEKHPSTGGYNAKQLRVLIAAAHPEGDRDTGQRDEPNKPTERDIAWADAVRRLRAKGWLQAANLLENGDSPPAVSRDQTLESNKQDVYSPSATRDQANAPQSQPTVLPDTEAWRTALRFYASKGHLWGDKMPDSFDTVSGEPKNWWFGDECPEWGVEDGTIAAMALRGERINWDGDEPIPFPSETQSSPQAPSDSIAPVSRGMQEESKPSCIFRAGCRNADGCMKAGHCLTDRPPESAASVGSGEDACGREQLIAEIDYALKQEHAHELNLRRLLRWTLDILAAPAVDYRKALEELFYCDGPQLVAASQGREPSLRAILAHYYAGSGIPILKSQKLAGEYIDALLAAQAPKDAGVDE